MGEDSFYLQGEQGFSQKHASLNAASHYYSQPFIELSGRIFWQGKWQKVTGSAWFDREWSSQGVAPDQQGWDWFSLHLTKDLALMVYRIRSKTQEYIYGSLMHTDGTIETLNDKQINLTTQHLAQSIYPESFKLKLEEHNIDIEVKIVNNKQIMSFGFEYFEGMVTFDGSHQGAGFVEMSGYKR